MMFVDPGAIGECGARTRTQQRAAERGRATQRSLCESF
jgi:hypothetical protein